MADDWEDEEDFRLVDHSQPGRRPKSQRDGDPSLWGSNVPSGQRGGVDTAEAQQAADRKRQTQRVSDQDRVIKTFDHVQFVACITDKISFNRNGDLMMTIQVPYQFKELALPMTDAFGIPLSFDVEVWAPYSTARDAS